MIASPAKNGLLYALAGFALLSCGDAVIKSMAGEWPGTAVAALRYCLGAIGLGALLWTQEGRAGFIIPKPKMQLLRGVSVAIATIAFFMAIFAMPLSEATSIVFISPMLTAILSAVFLGERAARATWIAAGTAFCGVLIILRPDLMALGPVAILPLIAALAMAFMMIGNRSVAGSGSALQMQFLIAVIAVPVLLLATLLGHFSGYAGLAVGYPSWSVVGRCLIVAVSASTAHWLVYMGTTRSSAAAIAPMVYAQLLVALALGIIFYGEWPDATALFGASIIVGAGLYLWYNQRPRLSR
jgi:drug/metabolite transporter (DMT)-like permease